MRLKFLIVPSVMLLQIANGQTSTSTINPVVNNVQSTNAPTVTIMPSASVNQADMNNSISSDTEQTSIMDYKSVYESATLEEEVKMAAERFSLTKSQQETWLVAATDRREAEKRAKLQLEAKDPNISRDGVYKGLRAAQNSFYETVTGYLSPAQKQAMESDRTILEEKRKRIAKLPPPPVATVAIVPIDSTAIKAEMEKEKKASKKSKKKKKPAGS